MKYKIIDIHEGDMFHFSKNEYLGRMVSLAASVYESDLSPNFQECILMMENGDKLFFIGVRLSPNPLEEL